MQDKWLEVKKNKPDGDLLFIHTPKCGGQYTAQILDDLGIENKNHLQSTEEELRSPYKIPFTVIRHPVDRFESFLNYRLQDVRPRKNWPSNLRHLYSLKNRNVSLNKVVELIRDEDFISFIPYRTLEYWTKNIEIILTIDELHDFLSFFGYFYDPKSYKRKNVSVKNRGTLNLENRERISRIYSEDLKIWEIASRNRYII